MKKLYTTILVALILVPALLAGCAATPPAASPTQAPAEQATQVPAEATPEATPAAEPVKVKIGVVGENNEQWTPVIESLKTEGIEIELVKFADYPLPNQALADGDIDLNAFQHHAYLNNAIKDGGFDLTVIGETIIAPLGLYSKTVKSVAEIGDNAKIAIPSDATNGGRALKVLEAAGLIKVNPDAGFLPTKSDITENPKNIDVIEVEAAQTPRLLEDVTASIINGGHAVDAGFFPQQDAIYLEEVAQGSDNPYINIIVARTADKDNAVYKKIVEAYQTDEVAKVIEEAYKGAYIPVWK